MTFSVRLSRIMYPTKSSIAIAIATVSHTGSSRGEHRSRATMNRMSNVELMTLSPK